MPPCIVTIPPARPAPLSLRHSILMLVLGALAACGGGSDDGDSASPAPAPGGNQAPIAAFASPGSIVAGNVASLDARASSDPESGALTFAWDFGDGSRGGAAQIAHVYSDAGSYTVRLRVVDAQGAATEVSRQITVTAAPAAARQAPLAGLLLNLAGSPLAGVRVAVQGSAQSATSDAEGKVALRIDVGTNVVLRLTKAGYADQTKVLNLPATVRADGYFEAALMLRAAAQTLADAAAGGTPAGNDGARLTLPPGALVDAAGSAVTGAVDVTLTPVDINGAALPGFPGRFEGLNGDGTRTPIVSYGTTEFTLSQGGRPLQLRPGARANIELPVYASRNLDGSLLAAGAALPLWSLDERSGQWVNEGSGTLVAAATSPTGLALRADVGHLSWWNADKGYVPFRPKPRCINDVPGQYDSIFEQALICKMLAEMDKPILAQGAAKRIRALAAPLAEPPRFPFPAVRIEEAVPIDGGTALDIPPDIDVVLTGTALNGTWRGQVKVKGAQGTGGDVNVPLRPIAQGGATELITLPFDQVRAAAPLRLDRYRFLASAAQGVEVSVQADASALNGTLRVRDPAGTLLFSYPFGQAAGVVAFKTGAAGEYAIEIEPATSAAAAYRLQVSNKEAPGRPPSTTLTLPGAPGAAKVAANANSDAVAVWTESVAGQRALRASRYLSATAGWGSARSIADATGLNDAVPLQIGLDAAGNATVAWDQGGMPRVARYTASSQSWGEVQSPASGACPGGLAQRLAVSAQGDVTLLWQRSGAAPGLCARHQTAGVWGTERVIDTAVPTATATDLSLAAAPDGSAVAAWVLDAAAGLASARYDTGNAGWSTPVIAATGPVFRPSIALAAGGSALLVWQVQGFVDAARWASGAPAWGAARRLGDSSGGVRPHAVWQGGTSFHVVWQTFDQGIRGVAFDAADAGTWGNPAVLANGRLAQLVAAGADSTGGLVAISWANKQVGGGTELLPSRLGGSGVWVDGPLVLTQRPIAPVAGADPGLVGVALGGGAAFAVWREFQGAPLVGVVAARFPNAP